MTFVYVIYICICCSHGNHIGMETLFQIGLPFLYDCHGCSCCCFCICNYRYPMFKDVKMYAQLLMNVLTLLLSKANAIFIGMDIFFLNFQTMIRPWPISCFHKGFFKAQNFQGIFPVRLWQLLCFSKSKLRGLYWHYSRWLWCIHIWGVRFHRSWDWVQCTSWSDNWTSRLSSILSHSAGML